MVPCQFHHGGFLSKKQLKSEIIPKSCDFGLLTVALLVFNPNKKFCGLFHFDNTVRFKTVQNQFKKYLLSSFQYLLF